MSYLAKHDPIELAIVGCGAITELAHLPAALRSSAINVYALVDTKVDNARALARKYGLKDVVISANLPSILEKVDGVLIATPNGSHYEVAKTVLEMGRPVLVEKPLTISSQNANDLCEVAKARGTFISVGYLTRHFPGVRLMKRLLESGDLGRTLSFHIEHGSARDGWEAVSGYTVDQKMAGGGVLIGTHYIDRILYWFGDPNSFTYADDSYGGVEASCKARFLFGSGGTSFTGTLFLSKTIALKNKMFVETEGYSCVIDQARPEYITAVPRDKPGMAFEIHPDMVEPVSAGGYFQLQLEEFASIIRDGGEPAVDGWFGTRSVRLVEEMYANRLQLDEPWLLSNRKVAVTAASYSHV